MDLNKRKVILLVEDEGPLLDSYSEILESEGYVTIKTEDGAKGLEALESNKGVIDACLLDLMMPGMDGLEVLRTVQNHPEKYGNAPIIVLTNMTSEKVIKEAFDNGASSYLIKTELEVDDFVKEIEKVIVTEEE
jgi:CheY-like chemotaxis protein